jgi:hypothetical protein
MSAFEVRQTGCSITIDERMSAVGAGRNANALYVPDNIRAEDTGRGNPEGKSRLKAACAIDVFKITRRLSEALGSEATTFHEDTDLNRSPAYGEERGNGLGCSENLSQASHTANTQQ